MKEKKVHYKVMLFLTILDCTYKTNIISLYVFSSSSIFSGGAKHLMSIWFVCFSHKRSILGRNIDMTTTTKTEKITDKQKTKQTIEIQAKDRENDKQINRKRQQKQLLHKKDRGIIAVSSFQFYFNTIIRSRQSCHENKC